MRMAWMEMEMLIKYGNFPYTDLHAYDFAFFICSSIMPKSVYLSNLFSNLSMMYKITRN